MRLVALENAWTGTRYRFARALLGVYLCLHFAQLLPYAEELFSSRGVLSDASLSPLYALFPSPFWLSDSPLFARGVVLLGAVLAIPLALGVFDRIAAIAIWLLWASLHARMPLIANPSIPFIGFLLLLHACLPQSPRLFARSAATEHDGFRFDPQLFAVLWIVMALGYSYSGYTKLVSPSWVDGTALAHVLENPLARDTPLRTALLALPSWLLALKAWGALGFELLFAPLALVRRLRPLLWLAMVAMHIGLLLLIDFADLTLAMLLVHVFTFDPGWLVRLQAERAARRAAAVSAG
jgi:hypothetical protein